MILFPNAKINLGLYVPEKRNDGYHNIETIFYPIPWEDVLEVVPSENATTLTVSGMQIDTDMEKNLVMKAYRLLEKIYELPPVSIYLHKVIPFGAGLGGGSSDAAFMLRLLNEQFHLNISEEELSHYASLLGSDCPFFIYNKPMLATGRGEILSPVDVTLSGMTIVLIKPFFGISTSEAYSGVTKRQPPLSITNAVAQPVSEWRTTLFNDFEDRLFVKYPELARIKNTLYEKGALYAAMSGSGSTIFGLFENNIEVDFPNSTTFKAKL